VVEQREPAAELAQRLLDPRGDAPAPPCGALRLAIFCEIPIHPGMAAADVPESSLAFPIGTLKTAGAAGLAVGLAGLPLLGTAAAAGLVLFFVCAVYTHIRAADYSVQFGLANGFLALNVATLALGLAATA
jgi:hypothetical protein